MNYSLTGQLFKNYYLFIYFLLVVFDFVAHIFFFRCIPYKYTWQVTDRKRPLTVLIKSYNPLHSCRDVLRMRDCMEADVNQPPQLASEGGCIVQRPSLSPPAYVPFGWLTDIPLWIWSKMLNQHIPKTSNSRWPYCSEYPLNVMCTWVTSYIQGVVAVNKAHIATTLHTCNIRKL